MKATHLVAALTLAVTLQVNAHSNHNSNNSHHSCSFIRGQLVQAQRSIDRMEVERRHADRLYNRIDVEVSQRVHELDRAHERVRSARSGLNQINYEHENGPQIIAKHQDLIKQNNLKIVEGNKLAEKLKKEYKAISKWHWVKRAKAKGRYKDQIKAVEHLHQEVQSSQNRIERLNYVAENFTQLQADAERHLYATQDQLAAEESVLPTISDLRERREFRRHRLAQARRRLHAFKEDLGRIRISLTNCENAVAQTGDGEHNRDRQSRN